MRTRPSRGQFNLAN